MSKADETLPPCDHRCFTLLSKAKHILEQPGTAGRGLRADKDVIFLETAPGVLTDIGMKIIQAAMGAGVKLQEPFCPALPSLNKFDNHSGLTISFRASGTPQELTSQEAKLKSAILKLLGDP